MTYKRLVIPSAVLVLAACAGPASKTGSGDVPLMQAPQQQAPVLNTPQELGAEVEAAKPAAAKLEPRIIKGNDAVIAPPRSVPPVEGASHTFRFEDAPISEVVHVMMRDILKVSYVLHHPVAGSVTLATRAPVSADNALAMLESALLANGLVMVRDTRGTYHVGKAEVLRNIGTSVRQPAKGGLPPGYGAIVVPLQYIGAAEMATILRPLMPAEALVRVDNTRNLLVLVGTRVQAEGWLELINTFDVNMLKGMSVGVFPLKHATVAEVEAALQLLGSAAGAPVAPAPGTPAGRAGGAQPATSGQGAAAAGSGSVIDAEGFPLRGAIRVMPIARINSILVVTPRAAYLEEARRWIEKLDQPSDNGAEPQLHIYKVQNGNAQHLASVLSGIFGGVAPSGPAATGVAPGLSSATAGTSAWGQPAGSGAFGGYGGYGAGTTALWGGGGRTGFMQQGGTAAGLGMFGNQNRIGQGAQAAGPSNASTPPVATNIGNVRVMADELNNSILVWSSKGEFQKIESTLKRLDLPPTQVLIEASIIEVTLNDTLKYGLQWAFSGGTGDYFGRGQLSSGNNNPGNTGSLNVAAGSGFTYSLTNGAGNVRVILDALASKTMVKVISNPSLMVLDNHVAMMAVGNQVPVQTSVTNFITNENAVTSTVQYRDTGVNLAVTPSVNAGNLVTMQIDQTVTDAAEGSGATANNQPVFLQRQISSKVAVRSGESIVLGGLIKDNQSSGKSGLPILQDLPVVGNLFGTNTNGGARTELLVVITPKVVRTDPEIREVSEELRDRLKGLELIELRDRAAAPSHRSGQLRPEPPQ